MNSKTQLRKYFKSVRKQMTDKSEADDKIFKLLISCDLYNSSDTIFVYVSTAGEVDTMKLISHSLSNGKIVAVPKCNTENCTMCFYRINSFDDLIKGAYDISEPNIEKCEQARQTENSLCIVPGLSFDSHGYRLGFGKGYYDRFLPDFEGKTIGLCYENCLSDELIKNEFDRKVSVLVTEKKIIKFENKEE